MAEIRAKNAEVDPTATIGAHSAIWDFAQIREHAQIGARCIIGRGAYIGSGVSIGNNCKVQNLACVYEPAQISDGVFVGPGAILTNDQFPRAINPDGSLKDGNDWSPVGVTLEEGASVGAGAVCVAPVRIGRWAVVAAGAVVVADVPDFALVAGVPAKRIKWVGRSGVPLTSEEDGVWTCPKSGERYSESTGKLTLVK